MSRYLERAQALAERFREDAAERDRLGGTPKKQRDWIRESGLLKLLIPAAYGGEGGKWSEVLHVIRIWAEADPALAHLYGYHFLHLVAPHLSGTEQQKVHYYTESAKHNWFWGNSSNPLDRGLIGKREGGRVIVNGQKSFSSGAADADILVISWHDADTGDYYEGIIPADRPGVEVLDDWEAMGQRQTCSGTVRFHQVELSPEEVLVTPYKGQDAFASLVPPLSQSILANIFVGAAAGALADARSYTLTTARAWYTSGYSKASEEPSILRQYGELWTKYQAALSLVEKAALQLDAAWQKDRDLTARERGELAVLAAAANLASAEAALEITSRIFEVMGARSAYSKYNFDRHWRNVRTHTLHNPAEFKLRNIGNWYVNGHPPEPGYYS